MSVRKSLIIILWVVASAACAEKPPITKTPTHDFHVEHLMQGFDVPWALAFVENDKLLLTERRGKLFLVDIKQKSKVEISGLPSIKAHGQGGLLDVALLPKNNLAAQNSTSETSVANTLYFTYSKAVGDSIETTLARAELVGGTALKHWQDLLVTRSGSEKGQHFGSRITFDDTGHVFFSVGDRGVRENGQDLSTHAGSIIRLNLDGSIPKDNPFIDTQGALPEIWSYGHRNPQGLVYDSKHQRLWSIEHGPRGGDEVNLIIKGKNYGWPEVSQGKEYWGPLAVGEPYKAGMEEPKKVYIPSVAPSSLALYAGNAFPNWQGNLLAGALKLTHLNRLVVDSGASIVHEERLLESMTKRIRSVVIGPKGWVYMTTDSGEIMRIKPKK